MAAGAKIASLKRLEWITLDDQDQAIGALLNNEVHYRALRSFSCMAAAAGSRRCLRGLKDYAAFFVRNGFVVLNLDSLGPRGNAGGTVCTSYIPVPVQRYLGRRIGFNRSAAEDSRKEMVRFFRRHVIDRQGTAALR